MTWHRPARVVVGVVALASAAAAYVSSTRRASVAPPAVERMDPKAVLESREAVLQQVRENEERFELKAERTPALRGRVHDGSSASACRSATGAGGTTSSRPRKRARARTPRTWSSWATCAWRGATASCSRPTARPTTRIQHIVRAPGDVAFTKGRLKGSATGMSYDTNTEVLSLLAKPDVRFEPGETDQVKAVQFQAGSAMLDRVQHLLSLENQATVVRKDQTMAIGPGRGPAVGGRAASEPGRAARELDREGRRVAREHDRPRHGSRSTPRTARRCSARC